METWIIGKASEGCRRGGLIASMQRFGEFSMTQSPGCVTQSSDSALALEDAMLLRKTETVEISFIDAILPPFL
jgi:hypothetical protein